jgi:hypothetical protein
MVAVSGILRTKDFTGFEARRTSEFWEQIHDRVEEQKRATTS